MLFVARRAEQLAGRFVAVGVIAAVLGGGLAATSALTDRAVDAGTSRIVADADPSARSVVVDAPADAADDEVASAIDTAFADVDVTVRRTTWATAPSGDGQVLLLADPHIADVASLVDGSWPSGDAVAVSASAAGLHPTTIDGAPVTVAGTWRARDAAAVAWAGEPAVASGVDEGATGPVLATAAFVTAHGHGPRAHWTISAAQPATADRISAYRAGLTRLAAAVDDLDEGIGVRTTGGWDGTLARAGAAAGVARGIVAVPVALLLVMGLLVLGVIARTLGRALSDDVALLRARGAAARAVVVDIAAPTAVVLLVAAGIGTFAGVAAGGGIGAAALIAGAVCAGALVLVTAVAASTALAATGARGDVSRRSLLALAGAAVFVAVVAGLAVWQLSTAGLVHDGRADATAAAAPALVIILGAVVIALLAGPVAALAERFARRGRGLAAVLALRRTARQASVVVAGVLSIALAAGAVAFAVTTSQRTQVAVHARVAHVVGADVRAVYDVSPIVEGTSVVSAAAVDAPAADVYAGFRSAITVGQTPAGLVALSADRLGRATGIPPSRLSGGAPAALDGTLTLEITAAGSDGAVHPEQRIIVRAWLVDASGSARRVDAGTVAVDGARHRLPVSVTTGDALAAVETSAPEVGPGVSVRIGARSGGQTVADPGGVTLTPEQQKARLVTVADASGPIPVVVTTSLSDLLSLHGGDAVALRVGTLARPVTGRIVAVRDSLPGLGEGAGAAVDLNGLVARALAAGGSVPAAGELWAHTDDVAATSAALRAVATHPVVVITAASIGTAPVVEPILALVAGGIGVLALLALGAFAVVSATAVRDRRDQAVPLRAFGFGAARQRRAAAIELTATAVFALVLGAAVGVGVAVWLGPTLTAALQIGGVA